MKTLIYITGQIDNPFFLNEIGDFVDQFDRIIVLPYAERKDSRYIRIADEYGFEYKLISSRPHIDELFRLALFFFSKDGRDELRLVKSSGNRIKKVMYMCVYALNAIKCEKALEHFELKDDIYVYSFWLSRGAYSAVKVKERYGAKRAISRAHGYDLYLERNTLGYLPFRLLLAKKLDEICFISENGREYYQNLCRDMGCEFNRGKVIHLGSRNPEYPITRKSNSNVIVFVSCSSIIHIKRLDLIIQVISKVRSRGIMAEWIHIGDGELKNEIEKMASKVLHDGYTFLGQMDNKEILKYYSTKQVDFFINMSDSEGIPVSIMEAMSVGIPVIARDVGGVAEIVSSNTGVLISGRNEKEIPDCCADDICKMLCDKERYIEAAKNAQNYWMSNFNLSINNSMLVSELLAE